MIFSRVKVPLINCIGRRFVENLPRHVRLEIDPIVKEQMKSDNRKISFFKEHKGKFHRKTELPKKLEETINTVLSDIEPHRLKTEIKALDDHLAERRLPIEQNELQSIAKNVIENLIKTEASMNTVSMSPEERDKLQRDQQRQLVRRLKSSIYHWQPLNFDEYRSKVYLATNFASQYAMLMQIFNEIKQREKQFHPVRLFDFGSGAGSTMWAALQVWGKKTFAEILNVDRSRDMNHLSQLILQGGEEHKPAIIPGVVYRQFLPHGRESTFDLVVASHTLFEFENRFERQQVLRSLWYNVKPGGFLIIVERGNLHGFNAIDEGRDMLLNRIAVPQKSLDDEDVEEMSTTDESFSREEHCQAQIFSPCPHEFVCPKKQLNIPCRIATRYRPLHLFDLQQHVPDYSTVQMSYIVVKKAERDRNDLFSQWPRVIEPILDRKHHQHVRLCCPSGEYLNVPISKNKNGVALHRLSHHAEPGDVFPVSAEILPTPTPNEPTKTTRRRAFRT